MYDAQEDIYAAIQGKVRNPNGFSIDIGNAGSRLYTRCERETLIRLPRWDSSISMSILPCAIKKSWLLCFIMIFCRNLHKMYCLYCKVVPPSAFSKYSGWEPLKYHVEIVVWHTTDESWITFSYILVQNWSNFIHYSDIHKTIECLWVPANISSEDGSSFESFTWIHIQVQDDGGLLQCCPRVSWKMCGALIAIVEMIYVN